MAWYDQDSWLTHAFGPHLSTIFITFLVATLLPILLHTWLYKKQVPASAPSFLLVGPSGAGKTSLLTLLQGGSGSQTHSSQDSLSVEIELPDDAIASSAQYRSENDPSNKKSRRFVLVDTPGHGKLRHFATDQLAKAQNLKGIIFMVDAATLSPSDSLTETADYLHDVLLTLQRRYTNAKTSKGPNEMPVLLAANKLDLFTALPAPLVKAALEKEITSVRNTKSKSLKDSGIEMGDDTIEEERDWLGDGGNGKFEFKQMEQVNVLVEIIGGNVLGEEGPSVGKWWDWIARQL